MKNTKSKTRTYTVESIYNEAIKTLVVKTLKWGYTAELTKQFSKQIGKPIFRQTIDCWLNRDPKKRSHPDYGNVVILLLSAEATDKVFATRAAKKGVV